MPLQQTSAIVRWPKCRRFAEQAFLHCAFCWGGFASGFLLHQMCEKSKSKSQTFSCYEMCPWSALPLMPLSPPLYLEPNLITGDVTTHVFSSQFHFNHILMTTRWFGLLSGNGQARKMGRICERVIYKENGSWVYRCIDLTEQTQMPIFRKNKLIKNLTRKHTSHTKRCLITRKVFMSDRLTPQIGCIRFIFFWFNGLLIFT